MTEQPGGTHVQVDFKGGVNPMMPAHLIGPDEVQTATNVDFSMMQGALTPRRGSVNVAGCGSTPVVMLYNNHNSASSIISGFLYAQDTAGTLYRGSVSSIPMAPTFTAIASGLTANAGFPAAMASVQGYVVVAGGTAHIKDDGTLTTEWIKQVPSAPTVVVQTLAPLTPGGTWTVPDGTLISSDTSTCIFATDEGNTANAVFAFTSATDMSVNLTTSGTVTSTHTVGDFGVQFINVAFSDPDQVGRISLDYSIGDGSFTNFWHFELQPQKGGAIVTRGNTEALINAQTGVGGGTNPISVDDRQTIWSQIAQYNFQPLSFIPSVADSSSPWAVPIPQFNLVAQNAVATTGAELWKSIYALRVGVVTTGTCTVTVGSAALVGSKEYSLLDIQSGYTYWDTYATLDTNGNKLDEGAPSPAAGPYLMQNAQAVVTHVGTATGTIHGITHRITYRQGGYMQDAYAVNTQTYSTATFTDTVSDIDALSNNFVMEPDLITNANFPGFVTTIAAPVADRIFFGDLNKLRWGVAGRVGAFRSQDFQEVGAVGDNIQGLIPYGTGLVIINRSSIFEFYGSDLDTGNFVLSRTAARRGSVAVKTIIKTPHGIPLLNPDGLTMYTPGYGMDQDIQWFKEKYGDIFRPGVPAWKGSRIPQLSAGFIHYSVAAWREGKLLLGLPTGTNSNPDTLFVLDFAKQSCWWYQYPFNFDCLLADDRVTDILVGDPTGQVYRIENTSLSDVTVSGTTTTTTPITWFARTRQWTVPTDCVLENLSAETQGTKIVAKARYDNSTNPAISTMTNSVRQWNNPPLNGTFVNSVEFDFAGTNTTGTLDAVYGMGFDMLLDPIKVRYHRTGYDERNYDADKLWDVQYYEIDISCTTGSSASLVTAVTFVDATAVMTYTFTGTTGGRKTFEVAFPAETYGRVAYTTYTSTDTTVFFKPWKNDYQTRQEPAKVAYWRSDIISDPEREYKVFKPEINCNGGTVLATTILDDVAISTHTITGTDRKQYTFSIPVEKYARTIWAVYNGVNGNVFKVYSTMWDGPPEPPRVTLWRHGPNPYPASNYLKTWSPLLDPIGGTVLGSLIVNDVVLQTATFTGNRRQWFTVGLDLDLGNITASNIYQLSTGSRWEVVYSGTGQFKHYDTRMETESDPYSKRSWSFSYRKLGGASQVDMARYWSIFCSVEAPAVATYWWDIDGQNFSTGTLTLTGQEWIDRIAFQPGARGREFQFRLLGPSLLKVRVVNVDLGQEGVKGLTRRGAVGTPGGQGPQASAGGPGGDE